MVGKKTGEKTIERKIEDDALLLAARFSMIHSQLKHCRDDDASQILYDYVVNGKNREKAADFLLRFSSVMPYLELIASKNGKKALDYDVIEAYWIGNGLLDNISSEDIKKMIADKFSELPPEAAEELLANIPSSAAPNHNFQILHAHSILGKVAPKLRNADKCRISVATVKKVLDDKMVVSHKPFIVEEKIRFGDIEEKEIEYDKGFLSEVKAGDKVAMHWDFPVCILTDEQARNLDKYTEKNVEAMNPK